MCEILQIHIQMKDVRENGRVTLLYLIFACLKRQDYYVFFVIVVDGVGSVVIVLVIVFCFPLFHTFSKVHFILSNAVIWQSTKKQLENVLYRLHPRRTLSNCLRKGNAVLHLCQLFLEFFDIF